VSRLKGSRTEFRSTPLQEGWGIKGERKDEDTKLIEGRENDEA
jgi:hypothetical protein